MTLQIEKERVLHRNPSDLHTNQPKFLNLGLNEIIFVDGKNYLKIADVTVFTEDLPPITDKKVVNLTR